MRIEGGNFALCPWRRGHEEALVRHANDADVSRWLADAFPFPFTPEDANEWLDRRVADEAPYVQLAIEVDGEACGNIGASLHHDTRAHTLSIGYWLGKAHWGRGIMTAAVQLYVRYQFEQTNVHRIEASVYDGNVASMRVLEKAGFKYEAALRERVCKKGRFLDEHIYMQLRSE